jgi:heme exporter protein A
LRGPGEARRGRALLELDAVRRRFGSREVLAGVSLAVPAGAVSLVVGPNGSGKSTLARIAVGLLKPTGGTVRVGGRDPRAQPAARRELGFVAHQSLLYDDLTPLENLAFVARLYGLDGGAERVAATLDRLEVGGERAVPLRRLSRGMVQRVALARAFLHQPGVLVLDEPFTGLDAPSAERLVELLEEARQADAAMLVVSHDLTDVWRLPASVAVLHRGRIAVSCDTTVPLAEFRERYVEAIRG